MDDWFGYLNNPIAGISLGFFFLYNLWVFKEFGRRDSDREKRRCMKQRRLEEN